MRFQYSAEGLAMTKRFEGLRLTAYQDSVGVWTIGYGHTGPDVHPGLVITESQATMLLLRDIGRAVDCVNNAVHSQINQHQFDAMVDFTFNLGTEHFLSSTLLRYVNAGMFTAAAAEFPKWDRAGGLTSFPLLERREAEEKLALEASADLSVWLFTLATMDVPSPVLLLERLISTARVAINRRVFELPEAA